MASIWKNYLLVCLSTKMDSIKYLNLFLIFWSFKNLTIWLVHSIPRFAWPCLIEISESVYCFYGYQHTYKKSTSNLPFFSWDIAYLSFRSTLTMPCHATLTWHVHMSQFVTSIDFYPQTKKSMWYINLFLSYYTFKNPAICLVKTILEFWILQDFGNYDKK